MSRIQGGEYYSNLLFGLWEAIEKYAVSAPPSGERLRVTKDAWKTFIV